MARANLANRIIWSNPGSIYQTISDHGKIHCASRSPTLQQEKHQKAIMPTVPKSVVSAKNQLELSSQQRALYGVLTQKDEELTQIYSGALYVFNQKQNPDYLALAAHGIRELLEKFPKIVGITPQKPDISSKCQQLADKWEKHALRSECYNNEIFAGAIDEKLHHFLDVAKGFFEWFRGRPSRRDERTETIRALDMTSFTMPPPIERIRTNELAEYANYFTSVSHHAHTTSEDDFVAHLNQLERFLLDFLLPRTFEDHAEIDALIQAGEEDAK
ncbi:MAG: hypothetical protein RPU64_11140 [Candidatus Sedimenticola sp. (ex Thyasira tokunagai)]